MNYEMALELKKELDYMNIVLEKQKVELTTKEDLDVINYAFINGFISLEFLYIRAGKLVGNYTEIEPVTDDYLNEIEYLIALFYNKREIPKQILIPDEIDEIVLKEIIDTNIHITINATSLVRSHYAIIFIIKKEAFCTWLNGHMHLGCQFLIGKAIKILDIIV